MWWEFLGLLLVGGFHLSSPSPGCWPALLPWRPQMLLAYAMLTQGPCGVGVPHRVGGTLAGGKSLPRNPRPVFVLRTGLVWPLSRPCLGSPPLKASRMLCSLSEGSWRPIFGSLPPCDGSFLFWELSNIYG